ncbi:MAG: thioredoxin domain-containing protein [Oscillospiraceae bacterium]
MEHPYTNRLIDEKSPYLLQHAHNPVNWYPWSKEAFAAAKQEDKPVFLSIGYSTCHWCHVMEQESFENEETAKLLNEHFIAVKVDREERPDIDAVYMAVCTGMTGSGGWPMTILMTPEQKPFFAGTYLPKSSHYGLTGLDDLLRKVTQLWQNSRNSLTDSAEKITAYFQDSPIPENNQEEPDKELLSACAKAFRQSFDVKNGGFGTAPKFPAAHNLLFLMKYAQREDAAASLQIAEKTLVQMYRGGIFDHLGGGFSRYSTDEKWLVPHFEKMLYDNALLILAYTQAYQITKKELYRTISEKTIDYILRELTHENGGFFCGQDADSQGVEGKYYVFTPEEVKKVLGDADGAAFCRHFDITESGNFEGRSIPNLLENSDYENQDSNMNALCEKLYMYRLHRTVLRKDDKILTSWNGLMIAALSSAYRIFRNPIYLHAAEKAQVFIENKLTDQDGRLWVRWRDGEAVGEGKLDDYAFYAWGMIALYDATLKVEYLVKANNVCALICRHFLDENTGGFYLYADDGEPLISRPKELFDSAMPSGNSVTAYVLQRLASLTAEQKWKQILDKQLRFLVAHSKTYPTGFSFAMLSVMREIYSQENLICVSSEPDINSKILDYLSEKSKTEMDVMLITPDNAEKLLQIAPFTAAYPVPEHGTMYYYCHDGICKAPVHDLEKVFDSYDMK